MLEGASAKEKGPLAFGGAVLLLLRASHPPAGATMLIVSLGLLTKPSEMVITMVSVVILIVPDG